MYMDCQVHFLPQYGPRCQWRNIFAAWTFRHFGSESMAAWWAVQEAARHCVSARLRTHFGNPTQTFAALERALQHALTAPTADASAPTADAGRSPGRMFPAYRSVWLLLEFMGALERNVHNAYEGGLERESLPAPVLAFFTANRKVSTASEHLYGHDWGVHPGCSLPSCLWLYFEAVSMPEPCAVCCVSIRKLREQESKSQLFVVRKTQAVVRAVRGSVWMQVCEEWFARMRPLLLRLAVAVDAHPAVLSHATAQLADLKGQLRAMLAEPKAPAKPEASQQVTTLFVYHGPAAAHSSNKQPASKRPPCQKPFGKDAFSQVSAWHLLENLLRSRLAGNGNVILTFQPPGYFS